MLNLIRSDFYKVFRMKSFWVICIVAASLMFLMEGPLSAVNIKPTRTFTDIVELPGSTYTLLLHSIFLSLFVTSEYKNGYIKNIAGNLSDRTMLIVSKLAVSFVVYWIIYFAVFLSVILASVIFCTITFEGCVFSEIITHILVVFLLSYAVGAVIILMAYGARNSGLSTTMAVMISGGMIVETINLFYMILVMSKVIAYDENFNIFDYFLTPYINYYEPSKAGSACIVAACYLIGSVVFTIIHVKKKDI